MKWYIRDLNDGRVLGPMSQADAEAWDHHSSVIRFNERLFEPEFVTTEEVETIIAEMRSVATAGFVAPHVAQALLARAIDTITLLSAKKEVIGSIEGGVLTLGELPESVSIDIRDYDTDSVDKELVKTDERGRAYFEVG